MRVTLLGFWLIPLGISMYACHRGFPSAYKCTERSATGACSRFGQHSLLSLRSFSTKRSAGPLIAQHLGTLPPSLNYTAMLTTMPRTIYRWFFWLYWVSYATGLVGYVLLLSDIFAIAPILGFRWAAYWGLHLLFYGLYFGVLDRDCAELCTDMMSAEMGVRL